MKEFLEPPIIYPEDQFLEAIWLDDQTRESLADINKNQVELFSGLPEKKLFKVYLGFIVTMKYALNSHLSMSDIETEFNKAPGWAYKEVETFLNWAQRRLGPDLDVPKRIRKVDTNPLSLVDHTDNAAVQEALDKVTEYTYIRDRRDNTRYLIPVSRALRRVGVLIDVNETSKWAEWLVNKGVPVRVLAPKREGESRTHLIFSTQLGELERVVSENGIVGKHELIVLGPQNSPDYSTSRIMGDGFSSLRKALKQILGKSPDYKLMSNLDILGSSPIAIYYYTKGHYRIRAEDVENEEFRQWVQRNFSK